MAKTIRQWLKEGLTPKQFKNAKNNKVQADLWNNKVPSLSSAILCGFKWAYMPQGFEYWVKKYDELNKAELK